MGCFFPFSPLLAQLAAIDEPVDPLFNPNLLISDQELTSPNAMTLEEIAAFLKSKSGRLAFFKDFIPQYGLEMGAAEIIYQASQAYRINPKVLLVLLQKEQSLVENPKPSQYNYDWATGYARCDSCDASDPAIAKYKGFFKQVDSAAGSLRFFMDNPKKTSIKPGLLCNIDSIPVIPANQATTVLYTYTPHFRGNYNFWRVWQRWFTQKFPDGMLVKTKDDDKLWLLAHGQILPFKSKAVFLSRYNPKNLVLATAADLASYTKGPEIKFLNFSLVKTEKKKTYLLAGDKKRLLSSEAFRYYGFDSDEIIKAKETDLLAYDEGEPISVKAKYPLGLLMQNKKTGGIYFVADGVKHPVYDKNLIVANFPTMKTRQVTADTLKKLKDGEPISFQDGSLVAMSGSSEIFLISNGLRRPLKNEATLETLGLAKENIIYTNEQTLGLHALGSVIDLSPTASALTQAIQ